MSDVNLFLVFLWTAFFIGTCGFVGAYILHRKERELDRTLAKLMVHEDKLHHEEEKKRKIREDFEKDCG